MSRLLLLALLALPQVASATPFWERWTAHIPCVTFQAPQPCPAITLWTETGGTGSTVGITIRNPHNLATEASNPHGAWLQWWSLNLGGGRSDDIDALGWYAEGRVRQYQADPGAPFTGPNWVAGTLDVTWTDGMYLAGCGPSGGLPSTVGFFQICPQSGFGGAVTFYWHLRSQVVRLPELTQVRFYGATSFAAGTPEEYGAAGPGAICNDVLACTVTVAPEPGTWMLVGTGLLVLGAIAVVRAWRKRRAPVARWDVIRAEVPDTPGIHVTPRGLEMNGVVGRMPKGGFTAEGPKGA